MFLLFLTKGIVALIVKMLVLLAGLWYAQKTAMVQPVKNAFRWIPVKAITRVTPQRAIKSASVAGREPTVRKGTFWGCSILSVPPHHFWAVVMVALVSVSSAAVLMVSVEREREIKMKFTKSLLKFGIVPLT